MKMFSFFKIPLILFFSILLLPVIFFTRVIRPFLLIRFGTLISTRIGHYASNTELYLCERDAGLQPKHAIDIFFNDINICNQQLKKMWGRILNICYITRLQRPLFIANSILPGFKKHTILLSLKSDRDIYGLYERTPIHLAFTIEEVKKGYEGLSQMRVPSDAKCVCFHARDASYLDNVFPNNDWHYHNYRNSNIDNYIPAMRELVKRGYYTLRMGAIVNKSLQSENQNIIDYATKFRTEFLDIFLSAKCYFFVSSGTGIDEVPTIFRKPIVYVNFVPLEYMHTWSSKFLIIFKKLWLRKERRLMRIYEILDSGVGKFLNTEQYKQFGIEIIDNTPDEITAVTMEMDERLKGIWQTTEEDEELQKRFWSLFRKSELHGVIRSRIGRDFLWQNKDLLE